MYKKIILMVLCSSCIYLNADILKTGQVKSYDQNGNEVSYGTVKDDGYYRKGLIRSYSRVNGMVTDRITDLVWQDNYSDNGGEVRQDTWSEAKAYCEKKGWRLPTVNELASIIDSGHANPSLTPNTFFTIAPADYGYGPYWTSTEANSDKTNRAWQIIFNRGIIKTESKFNMGFVRCVKGPKQNPLEFVRNNSKQTVKDKTNGLEWQDTDTSNLSLTRWIDAISYCENLTLGGYSDWRLPNYNELLSIVNYQKNTPAINSAFQNVKSKPYITSTTDATTYNDGIWYVHFDNGSTNPFGRTQQSSDINIRCVRGKAIDTPSVKILPSVIIVPMSNGESITVVVMLKEKNY